MMLAQKTASNPQATRIAGQLQFVDTDPSPSRSEVLDRLQNGEISAEEAIRSLEALK